MGCCVKLLLLAQLIGVVLFSGLFLAVVYDVLPPKPPVPEIPNTWFGKGDRVPEDKSVRPFTVKIDEKVADTVFPICQPVFFFQKHCFSIGFEGLEDEVGAGSDPGD